MKPLYYRSVSSKGAGGPRLMHHHKGGWNGTKWMRWVWRNGGMKFVVGENGINPVKTPFRPPRNPHGGTETRTRDPSGGRRASNGLRHEAAWMYYKPTKFNQNRWSHFWEIPKLKKTARDIYMRTLYVEFERDRSIGLGSTFGDGHTRTRTHARTHARPHARTHTRTHARTHAHTERERERERDTDIFSKTRF